MLGMLEDGRAKRKSGVGIERYVRVRRREGRRLGGARRILRNVVDPFIVKSKFCIGIRCLKGCRYLLRV